MKWLERVVEVVVTFVMIGAVLTTWAWSSSQIQTQGIATAVDYWLGQGYSAYADPSGNLLPTTGDNLSDIGSAGASWNEAWIDGQLNAKTGRGTTYTIAASDAPAHVKAQADFTVSGNAEDEINGAIALANGGHIILSQGTFTRTAGVTIALSSNTWLSGQGFSTRIVTGASDTGGQIITASGAVNVRISDMYLDGTNIAGTGYVIAFVNADESKIDHIWIDGKTAAYGLILIDSTSDGNIIESNHLVDHALKSIQISGSHNIINGNVINSTAGAGGEGICIEGSYNTAIGNTLTNTGDSLIFIDGGNYSSFVGNTILNSTVNAIMFYEGTTGDSAIGNIIYGVGTATTGQNGIYVNKNSDNHTIANNRIIQVPGWGGAGTASRGILVRQADGLIPNNLTITGNTIANWKSDGIYLYGAPGLAMYRVTISGNEFSNNGGNAINADNLRNSSITGNTITGNAVDGIYIYNGTATMIAGNVVTGNGGWGINVLALAGYPTWVPKIGDNSLAGNSGGSAQFLSTDNATMPHTTVLNASNYGIRQRYVSPKLDLSGANTTYETYQSNSLSYIVGYQVVYTEASSGDAGVTLRVGKYNTAVTDASFYDSVTSETSKAKGYSKGYTIADLTNTLISNGDIVTVSCDGSKVGTGEVIIIIDVIEWPNPT